MKGNLDTIAFITAAIVLLLAAAAAMAEPAGPIAGRPGAEMDRSRTSAAARSPAGGGWAESLAAMLAERAGELREGATGQAWLRLEADHPVPCDWALRDGGIGFPAEIAGPGALDLLRRMAARALEGAGEEGGAPALDAAAA
ncbi:MAG: hypothetical protein JXA90_12725 [Planctomycetes bacterium]|nr:hypothetical protein [Planctomycetota bacterium]